jgi:stage III sporulation protein AF
MGELKGWIVNVCTAVFFITAVEMVLPDNNMKKYSKFVLGLILITVLINPIVVVLNHGKDMSTFLNKSIGLIDDRDINVTSKDYKNVNVDATLQAFKKNLEESTKKRLEEKFSENDFSVNAKVQFNKDKYEIKQLEILVNGSGKKVETVKKVEINTSSNLKDTNKSISEMSDTVKSFLSQELKVSKDQIYVYKEKIQS